MKKLLLPLLITAALSGCASFPENYEKPLAQPDILAEKQDLWSSTPAVSYVSSSAGLAIRKYGDLPAAVASQPIQLHIPHDIALEDVLYALSAQGYKVVSRLKAASGSVVPGTFKGTLGELLETLSYSMDVAYEYRNGVVFITDANRFSVALPQHKELMEAVVGALTQMGATEVRADLVAGLVYFSAKPEATEYIKDYLDAVAENSAMVTLQVAVLTVNLKRDFSLGFDWGAFTAQYGTKGYQPGKQKQTAELGELSEQGELVELVKQGALASMTGGEGLAYRFVNDAFSLTAAIRALSTFGDARTDQNVVMGTLSGVPVGISSGNEIPYIESIGDRTNDSGNVTGGTTTTATVDSGLKLNVTPFFDAGDMSVVTSVNVDMASLVGFRELSAGNALGTLSRPEMQKLTFENISRLKAGETIVIGGISYDQLSNNNTSLPGLEKAPVGSVSNKVNRHAIFIVVRPSVVVFARDAAVRNAALAGGPSSRGASAPAELPVAPSVANRGTP